MVYAVTINPCCKLLINLPMLMIQKSMYLSMIGPDELNERLAVLLLANVHLFCDERDKIYITVTSMQN